MPMFNPRLLAATVLAATVVLAVLWWSPGNTPEPIRVGVLHSLSGDMAVSEAPLVDALRLASEEINAAGGLLGRPLTLVVADGRSNPAIFAREARRLIEEEGVSVLFGCWTSDCRKAVKTVVEEHRHLLFYPVQYEGLEDSPHIVYTGAAPNQQIIPGADWALNRFGKRVYLVGSDYIFPRTANLLIRDLVFAASGQVVGEAYRPPGDQEFAGIAADIARQRPDVILNTVNGDSNLGLFEALARQGANSIPLLSFSLGESELTAWRGRLLHPQHYAVWGYFQSLDSAANRSFVQRFQARFGQERVTSDPIEASYNGLRLWANAVSETGSTLPLTVLYNLGSQSLPGPSGQIAVDNVTRHLWRWVHIGHAQATGQFQRLHSLPRPVRPVPYPGHRSQQEWQQLQRQLQQRLSPLLPPDREGA